MKVSVLITTYNQQQYIAQAINSVLMQEVSFAYEIVVGEDFSNDGTRGIVLDLQDKYPHIIRVLLRNQDDSERDRAINLGGKTNFVNSLLACQGEYVALLDGDDYWTDIHKLQKQVDFLEGHPECAICFHNVLAIAEDGSRAPALLCPTEQKEISTLENLLSGNLIPACSAFFRAKLFDRFPDWYFTSAMGDWPLHILNAQHGSIGYINEVMATYRVHAGGGSYAKRPSRQLLEMIDMLDHVDEYLNYKFKHLIRATKARYYYQLALIYRDRGHLSQARRVLKQSILCWGFTPRRALGLLVPRELSVLERLETFRGFLRRVPSQSKPVRS
jgi:glycosyltransferase involved in cell wall biosynthesis